MKGKYKHTYMECARAFAKLSHAQRNKVGAVAVTPEDVMLYSWNGTASGDDNCCEYREYYYSIFDHHSPKDFPLSDEDDKLYRLVTLPTVLHAERNIIAKAAKEGISLKGATLYVTMSCCLECALMIYQAGISKVVYDEEYRMTNGIDYLTEHGVEVEKYED